MSERNKARLRATGEGLKLLPVDNEGGVALVEGEEGGADSRSEAGRGTYVNLMLWMKLFRWEKECHKNRNPFFFFQA